MCRKKVTAKLLITDLLIIDEILVLNFKRIAIHVGIENKPDDIFKLMYIYTFSVPCCFISLK